MVTETTQGASPFLTVSRARAAAQIAALGLPRNALSAALLPEEGEVSDSRQTYGPQEQAALQVALPLLASPALVARIRAVLDDGHALATWAVTGTCTDPALTPYLLLAHDEKQDTFQVQPVPDRAALVRSLLPYVDLELPARSGDAFDLPVGAFTLLVALCDLYRRARFASGLDHAASPLQFPAADVERAYHDGRTNADPRWLLPHLLALRPDLPETLDLARLVPMLAGAGWLASSTDPVSLSEAGVRLANDLDRRLAVVSFWVTGATAQGELAERSALFVRSPWHIWCFDVGCEDGSTVGSASVDLATTFGLLEDLLTPVGVPKALEVAAPAPQAPAAQPTARGPKATARAGHRPSPAPAPARAIPPPAGKRFCPHCGKPLSGGARFCGSCGKSLE